MLGSCLPPLVRALNVLRNLAMASRPFSDPSGVMVSWSLDTRVRASLCSLA